MKVSTKRTFIRLVSERQILAAKSPICGTSRISVKGRLEVNAPLTRCVGVERLVMFLAQHSAWSAREKIPLTTPCFSVKQLLPVTKNMAT